MPCLAPKGALPSTRSALTEEFAPVGDGGTAPRVHGFPAVTRGSHEKAKSNCRSDVADRRLESIAKA
jgi:hypothetical protein